MKKAIISCFVMLLSVGLSAQVTGNVSEGENPLPGASVVIKGTTSGASTDFDGNFSIDAQEGDVLIAVSYTHLTLPTN